MWIFMRSIIIGSCSLEDHKIYADGNWKDVRYLNPTHRRLEERGNPGGKCTVQTSWTVNDARTKALPSSGYDLPLCCNVFDQGNWIVREVFASVCLSNNFKPVAQNAVGFKKMVVCQSWAHSFLQIIFPFNQTVRSNLGKNCDLLFLILRIRLSDPVVENLCRLGRPLVVHSPGF